MNDTASFIANRLFALGYVDAAAAFTDRVYEGGFYTDVLLDRIASQLRRFT